MPQARPALIPAVTYQDPRAALDWLERAFGFELVMLIEDAEGRLGHSEMRHGDALVMIGDQWTELHRSPKSLGGKVTQTIHIEIATDLDEHCARARAAGAEILMEPADQFYGARTYRCRDLEGHLWTVSQAVEDVTRSEAEARSGLKITAPDWA
jgi:uncharacterized glyoxalase superfamily protein PhnB